MNPGLKSRPSKHFTLHDLSRWADVVATGTPLLAGADDPLAHVLVSEAHLNLGAFAPARAVATQALARWPTSESAILAAANADLRLSLHTRALALAREGLAHHPDSTALRAVLGQALLGLNNPQQASEAFKAVLALKPSSAYYHYLMSLALWHLSHPDQARMQLEVALSIEPTNPDYLALSAQYERQRNPSRAVQVLRTALRLQPQDVSSQRLLQRWTASRLPLVGGMGAGWLLCALVSLGGVPFAGASALAWALNALVALRLSATQPTAWLVWFCGVHAVLLGASNTTGLPMLLRTQGLGALLGPETLFFAAGTGVMVFGMVVLTTLVRWLLWGGLVQTWTTARELWGARRHSSARTLAHEMLRRPGVQFNLIAGTCLGLSASPLVPLHLAMPTQVFVLPPVLCVLAWLWLPQGARPPVSVVFFMLGFLPAMVTMVVTSLLAEPVAAADQWAQHWKHWAYALTLGLYGAMLAQQAQTP